MALTGAMELHENLKEMLRQRTFAALVLIDIDNFHALNEEHGEEAGDRIIALIEDFIVAQGWSGYRIGGDLFGLVLKQGDASFDNDKLKSDVQVCVEQEMAIPLTFSSGGIESPGEDFGSHPRMEEVYFSVAQQLLAVAKERGPDHLLWLPHEPDDASDLTSYVIHFYRELAKINSAIARELEIESRIDFLTGLSNRRGFEDTFRRMADAARRRASPLGLLYMDSDSLKKLNDSKGHDAGDRFIIDISTILNDVVRSSDFVSRWGADEFAVLIDDTTPEKAATLGQRIQYAIQTRTEGTISIGVYCGIPENTEDPIHLADRALYRAKAAGKNRIELA
jgi:diguanylate cyclase (GGDEF)-like protein